MRGDHCCQGGVGGVDGDRAWSRRADVGGQFTGVGGHGDVGADWFVVECLACGADRDGGAFASGQPPGADRLGQQVQCRQQNEDAAAGCGARGRAGGDQGLTGAAGGDHARAGVLGEDADGRADGFLLVGAQFEGCGGHGDAAPGHELVRGSLWHRGKGLFGDVGDRVQGGAFGAFSDVELAGDAAP
ncbi:hypothetical protein GCM10010326_78830 [Streptomyces xanthochromogenes]|uniref:Uncharacterized protein n=1 Tax=Streptomyces xanthochromogenes TaxID=67384 RepID=A0ABQ3B4K2_9ACTN|nr:hypothetical protein GCM10010326_78830 [Streptomyces xanthochromogenes]